MKVLKKRVGDQRGQVVVEYLFLIAVVVTLIFIVYNRLVELGFFSPSGPLGQFLNPQNLFGEDFAAQGFRRFRIFR